MIAVGRISKSVGIRGEVSVVPLTDDPQRFAGLETVWIGRDEATSEQYTIASVRLARSAVILKLNEIESRTVAETKRGEFIYVEEKDTSAPPAGSYFIHQIIGMEVFTDNGEAVGVIREVLQLPANDVWVVVRGKKEILIPAIKEIIASVDVQRRTVVIHPMEGLLE
jgi:16S rRNA processing protein RimM